MLMREHEDGAIETWHRPVALPLTLAIAGLVAAIVFLAILSNVPRVVAFMLAALAVLCLGGAWVQRVPTRFLFDRQRRLVLWKRRRAFGIDASEAGQCSFADVRQVVLQPGPGKLTRHTRLALLLDDGLQPLARDFDLAADEAGVMAERLRSLIGLPSAEDVTARVLATARAGGDEAAITMLRERDGLTREQAAELLEHLKTVDDSLQR